MEKENLLQGFFDYGFNQGIKQMQKEIQKHCKSGKPLLINGELYFIQDSRQHLIEVMNQIDKEHGI